MSQRTTPASPSEKLCPLCDTRYVGRTDEHRCADPPRSRGKVHFEFLLAPPRGYFRTSCGAIARGRRTRDVRDVTCSQCRCTKTYKRACAKANGELANQQTSGADVAQEMGGT